MMIKLSAYISEKSEPEMHMSLMPRTKMKFQKITFVFLTIVVFFVISSFGTAVKVTFANGISYTSSSHGSNGEAGKPAGVNRASVDNRLTAYATGNCAHCHEQHSSINGTIPNPGTPTSRYGIFDVEQDACLACHQGTAASDIKSDFTIGGTPNIITYHGLDSTNIVDYIFDYNNRHLAHEDGPDDYGPLATEANRHAECTDCHNPHKVTAIDTADTTVGPIVGSTGVFPSSRGGNWAIPAWTNIKTKDIKDRLEQYMVCYKCHSNWAGVGTGTNLSQEFNVNNEAYHNAEGSVNPPSSDTYGNFQITGDQWAYKMMPRYDAATNATLRNAQLICSDCHGNSDISPQGIHGSSVNNILKVPDGSPYTTWDENSDILDANIWCYNCHDSAFTNSGFASGASSFHNNNNHQGNDNAFCMSCHAAIPHGYKNYRMLICDDESDPVASSAFYVRGTRAGAFICAEKSNWASSGGWTRNICHGGGGFTAVTTCPD